MASWRVIGEVVVLATNRVEDKVVLTIVVGGCDEQQEVSVEVDGLLGIGARLLGASAWQGGAEDELGRAWHQGGRARCSATQRGRGAGDVMV